MDKNKKTINAVIIDDEKEARDTLKFLLKNSDYPVNITDEAADPDSAIKIIKKNNPDLIFLDIELQNGNGFEVVEAFPEPNFKIIFVTGFNNFAIKAFRCSAVDYILKPIDPDILSAALDKIFKDFNRENFGKQITTLINHFKRQNEAIVLNTHDTMYFVEIKDIIRCQSDINYTVFYLNNKQKIVVSKPLKEFEDLLGEYGFFRTHQSHLINIKYIVKFDKKALEVILNDKSKIPVSYRKKDKFINFITNFGNKF